MPPAPIHIAPRRSATFFALLAVTMVVLSYVLILCIAAACASLPILLITTLRTGNAQLVVLAIGGVVIAATILFSIFPRRDKFLAPGPLLDRSQHPRLFEELDLIAAALNERLPREVYLIGEVNAFVTDRGGILGFGSRRVMGVGLPLLATLGISEFRGVLAHEFAHYYGGDTRLGPWVYKTHTTVARTFQNISSIGQSVGLPPLFRVMQSIVTTILEWYFVFFLRVINFVSRKAEFRADELACIVAGTAPVAQGLRLIHGAALAWPSYWNSEVAPVIGQGSIPPIGLGFASFLKAPNIADQVDKAVADELAEGKTSPFDSHPPLKDRLSALQHLSFPEISADSLPAISLLSDAVAAELLFIETCNPDIPRGSLRQVQWSEITDKVTLPAWRSSVSSHLHLLQGYTIGHLPGAIRDLSKFAQQIKDPPGMLLTPAQRIERAAHLLAVATALCLIENGWVLNAHPGTIYLQRGDEQLNVFTLVRDLRSGALTLESWEAKCRALGIAELRLGSAQEQQLSAAN